MIGTMKNRCARKRIVTNMERTLTIASPACFAALFLIVLVTRAYESTASPRPPSDPPFQYWRKGYSGHGTTHEQVGALHFDEVEYTRYVPSTNYSQRENVTKMWVDVIFKLSRTFFDKMFPLDPTLPFGYITDLGKDNMRLGPKVIRDDWADWLNAFWLMWAWVLLLAAIIVLAPFAGVVYFCFCCHRCKLGCPACHSGENRRKTCFWGTCLLLLLALIAGSMTLAFLSNGMLERGMTNTEKTLEMGSVDTCNFLKDVSDHIHHLFVNNYEELESHLINTIMDAPKHLFKDLNDVAEGNAVAELARIFGNFPAIPDLLKSVNYYQYWRQTGAIRLTTLLRSAKREVNYAMVTQCGSVECLKFLQTSGIEFFDTSKCLHLDELPETSKLISGMESLVKHSAKPVLWLARLRNVSRKIKEEMERVSPPIIRDIRKARFLFAAESRRIEEIIDVVISDIHLATIRASRAFEDLYDKFNETRYFVVLYIAAACIVIMILMVLALIIGCLGRRPTGASNEYFTTRLASYLLILTICLIFCALSVMMMVVMFYFVIGGVAYKGACAPLRGQEQSALLQKLDSAIDLRTMFSARNVEYPQTTSNQTTKPIRVSRVIKECQGENYLFKYLQENRIFDIDDFLRVKIITPAVRSFDPDLDLSKEFILTEEDREVILTSMEDNLMGLYHVDLYVKVMCPNLDSLDYDGMINRIRNMKSSISWKNYNYAVAGLEHVVMFLVNVKGKYVRYEEETRPFMMKDINDIGKLILYENFNFADSLKVLRQKVMDAEEFIRNRGTTYISTLGQNLTAVIDDQINGYIRMILMEAHTKIGRCKPLTYIYERGLELVCKRMVDPINGYWMGVSMAAFLLIPVALIAHRLQCLFQQHRVVPIRAIRAKKILEENPCPFCNAEANRMPGGLNSSIGQDPVETTILDEVPTSEDTANINDADRKNKLD